MFKTINGGKMGTRGSTNIVRVLIYIHNKGLK